MPRWFYIEFRNSISWVTISGTGCTKCRHMAQLAWCLLWLPLLFPPGKSLKYCFVKIIQSICKSNNPWSNFSQLDFVKNKTKQKTTTTITTTTTTTTTTTLVSSQKSTEIESQERLNGRTSCFQKHQEQCLMYLLWNSSFNIAGLCADSNSKRRWIANRNSSGKSTVGDNWATRGSVA